MLLLKILNLTIFNKSKHDFRQNPCVFFLSCNVVGLPVLCGSQHCAWAQGLIVLCFTGHRAHLSVVLPTAPILLRPGFWLFRSFPNTGKWVFVCSIFFVKNILYPFRLRRLQIEPYLRACQWAGLFTVFVFVILSQWGAQTLSCFYKILPYRAWTLLLINTSFTSRRPPIEVSS